ncbi:MAG TPA: hypothetical protein VMU76_02790 [Acidimicrobiales bacterium]|nr:hypothetical protein [Acidimicrobiales bacterium]
MLILRIVSVIVGAVVVAGVLLSALRTVVVPGLGFTRITRFVFAVAHRAIVRDMGPGGYRGRRNSLFAPVSLVSLPLVWMLLVTLGFACVFWGSDVGSVQKAVEISGSSLFTLGFAEPSGSGRIWMTFVEATFGLGLVALLISYLPTIYGAYNSREKGIRVLRPLAGTPPSGLVLLKNVHRFGAMDNLELWNRLSDWLVDLEQSHASFPALCYFGDQLPDESWVASVGAVLDGAALLTSASDPELDPRLKGPMLALAHGMPAVVRVGQAAGLPIGRVDRLAELLSAAGGEPPRLALRREECEAAFDDLVSSGVVEPFDREEAWHRFGWIRSGYDEALQGLAGLTGSTPAPWTTDRPATVGRPRLIGRHPLQVVWPPSG